jgi:hypothetical protein
MITSTGAGAHVFPAQAYASRTMTPADALPVAHGSTGTTDETRRIQASAIGKLDTSGLKVVSIKDMPELRDLMATMWLDTQAAELARATEVPDNAPQNVYATVKVNGNVVATLYNGGSSWMTNEAAGKVGNLQDPPGLNGGPNLAQWRAESIAKATGGTIEKAPTAMTQSEWTPRPTFSRTYSRAQLDAAFEAMMAERQQAAGQRPAGYAPPESSGFYKDFSA